MTENSDTQGRVQKSVEQILEAEEHIIRIEPGERWDFPDIDYSNFEVVHRGAIESLMTNMRKALSAPYIIDDFQDHEERRVWRKDKEQTHGKPAVAYLANNSLRRNVIFRIMSTLAVLKERYSGKDSDEFKASTRNTLRQYNYALRFYDQKTPEQKIDLVKALKRDTYAILQKLSKEPGKDNSS